MSYAATTANRYQETQESQLYLDRYQSPASRAESDYDFDKALAQDSNFSQNDGDPQAQYQRLAAGQGANGNSQDYLDAIDDIQNGIDAQEQEQQLDQAGADPAQTEKNLQDLKSEMENSELPKTVKDEYLAKQKSLEKKFKAGQLEDVSEVEDLKSEFEDYQNQNPSFARRIVDGLKDQGLETSEDTVRAALKKFQLSEQSLKNVGATSDSSKLNHLMEFLKEVDPSLSQTLAQDPDQGFSADALNQIKSVLGVISPETNTLDLALKLVDLTNKSQWNNNKLKSSITGEKVHYDGDYNNRFYNVDAFSDRIFNISASHSSGDLADYLNRGRNDVDNGAKNKGLEVRKFLTGLFEVSNHNPFLFRHYLKQLPDDALLAMKDVLDYRGGGGNSDTTQNIGERWNTQTSSLVLRWVIGGGGMPPELESDLTRAVDSPRSSTPSTP